MRTPAHWAALSMGAREEHLARQFEAAMVQARAAAIEECANVAQEIKNKPVNYGELADNGDVVTEWWCRGVSKGAEMVEQAVRARVSK